MALEQSKIQALVKVGKQTIYTTLLEIAQNGHRRLTSPTVVLLVEAFATLQALLFQCLDGGVNDYPDGSSNGERSSRATLFIM